MEGSVESTQIKQCGECKQAKPAADFGIRKASADGLQRVCRECAREYAREHYQVNRDRRLEWQRGYHAKNADEINEAARLDRQCNPDRQREIQRRKHRKHPHLAWKSLFKNRTPLLYPKIEDFIKSDVIAKYGDGCAYCTEGPFQELDHHIAVALGGHHTLENVRPTCRHCHHAKTDQDMYFIEELKRRLAG